MSPSGPTPPATLTPHLDQQHARRRRVRVGERHEASLTFSAPPCPDRLASGREASCGRRRPAAASAAGRGTRAVAPAAVAPETLKNIRRETVESMVSSAAVDARRCWITAWCSARSVPLDASVPRSLTSLGLRAGRDRRCFVLRNVGYVTKWRSRLPARNVGVAGRQP